MLRFVRRVFGGDAQLEHFLIAGSEGIQPWVFQNASLEGDVQKIAIHRIGLFRRSLDRNVLLLAISDHFGAAGKFLAERDIAPGSNHLQVRRKRRGRELEADLIVAFSGRAVRQRIGFFLARDLNHRFGDEWPRDAGPEKILAFVHRAGLKHRKNEIARKLLLQIGDITLRSAGFFCFGFEPFELLFLADISAESDDFRIISVPDPGKDD